MTVWMWLALGFVVGLMASVVVMASMASSEISRRERERWGEDR
jgi:uncharacterized protein involved in exopolysaccharide biosynthesis